MKIPELIKRREQMVRVGLLLAAGKISQNAMTWAAMRYNTAVLLYNQSLVRMKLGRVTTGIPLWAVARIGTDRVRVMLVTPDEKLAKATLDEANRLEMRFTSLDSSYLIGL